jgi:hypothetical protein
MPQLRSCYFCGAVGDSLREYDLAPDDHRAPERSHSAVLCSACHEKLRRVLEPLIDEGSSEGSTDPGGKGSSAQAITFDADGSPSGGSDGTAESGESDPETVTTTDATDDHDGSDGADPPEGADDDGDREATADSGAETDDTDGGATGAADDDAGTEAGGDPDVPESYYKVLRLLQNREFPMERAELTTLVTAAYDVSEPQCERILETAIDRGVLVEDGSTLDLGRN